MPAHPSPELFELVHALAPSELRAFGQMASAGQHGAPAYLRLLHAIARQNKYDEAAVKQQFTGEPCLRQFTRLKNYLYEQLLAFCCGALLGNTPLDQVQNDYRISRFLAGRNLHGQALKRLGKALKWTRKYELSRELPGLISWKRHLLKATGNLMANETMAQLHQEEREALTRLQAETEAVQAYERELELASSGQAPADFQSSFTPPPAPKSLPFDGQLAHCLASALGYRRHQQAQASHAQYLQALELWHQNPHQLDAYPERYLRLVSAFLSSAHRLGTYTAFTPWLDHIRNHPALTEQMRSRILCTYYNLRLLYHLNQDDLEAARPLSTEMQSILTANQSHPSTWLPAALNLSVFLMLDQQFRAAGIWLDRIRDLSRGKTRRDLQEMARLLYLVVLLETEREELLPYAVRSAERYIQQERPLKKWEWAWLGHCRNIGKARNHRERRAQALELRAKLEAEADSNPGPGHEEISRWLQQHLP